MSQNNIFEKFTNQYALSKTLRFELKPDPRTLAHMRGHLQFDESLQTFLDDQEIEDAYQILKPVFDKIHEEFITASLESKAVSEIDFLDYFVTYEKKEDVSRLETKLRQMFDGAYIAQAEIFKQKAGKDDKDKEILKKKGIKILTEKGILDYVARNVDMFSEINSKTEIEKAVEHFRGFFTYFAGFNQNRENYYTTKDSKATAVATRIVDENLPKFCDNIIAFKKVKDDYLNAFNYLKEKGNLLLDKDDKQLYTIDADIFEISHFNQSLSQTQIEEYNQKIGNANFVINLFNQAVKSEGGAKKLSYFKTLYKQIGCGERDAFFFTLTYDTKAEAEENKDKVLKPYSVEQLIKDVKTAGEKYFKGKTETDEIKTTKDFTSYILNRENYIGIYWSKIAVNTISSRYFADWHMLKDKLVESKVFTKGPKGDETNVKIPDAIELKKLFDVLDAVTDDWKDEGTFFKKGLTEVLKENEANKKYSDKNERRLKIITNSEKPSQALLQLIFDDLNQHVTAFLTQSDDVHKIKNYTEKDSKEVIKSWIDHTLSITSILKYFKVKEAKVTGESVDSVITQGLDFLLPSEDANWFKFYDALRNYLTKKPQDDIKKNKLKLNFENSTLADGWDVNKESDNFCIILQNELGRRYLAILKNDNKKIFEKELVEGKGKNKTTSLNILYAGDNLSWKKMEYKLLPGPNKMLPKCLLPKSDRKKFGATDEILKIYEEGGFKKNEPAFTKEKLVKLIDFYKLALAQYEDWRCFDFVFKDSVQYADISQFYSDVEKQGYKLNFVGINKVVLERLVEEGQIYLFEIKNQDSNNSKKSGHKNNLHTIYWNAIFESVVNKPKLNGSAELFYRKALATDKLEFITDKNGKEVIKNYRFSQEKFLFHVPITLNFCKKNYKLNDIVNRNISLSKDVNFLGIDRGEKHLAYYALVNQKGEILSQGSFNEINGQNYNEKLEILSGNRMQARKNWQTIGTIKELKDGYISQVVRKIVDMAVDKKRETPSFIVLENLNVGFMRGRQKIEKSVYQKLELALAKKLNFLVDKNVQNGELGSVTSALQLTPPVDNFVDIENKQQLGIMLYTKADYTSQTDPTTGWRKSVYLKKGSEEFIKEKVINAFSNFGFDGEDYHFDYVDSNNKLWKLYSGVKGISLDRYRGERNIDHNQWESTPQNIVKILDGVFKDFDHNRSYHDQIVGDGLNPKKINEHTGWESLRFAIELIQQIRNTGASDRDNDFLMSPVRSDKGEHYDSRIYLDIESNSGITKLPSSGDANGAYNIARKGIIMNEHIKMGLNPFIRDEEWDAWLAGEEVWKAWMDKNKKILEYKNKIT